MTSPRVLDPSFAQQELNRMMAGCPLPEVLWVWHYIQELRSGEYMRPSFACKCVLTTLLWPHPFPTMFPPLFFSSRGGCHDAACRSHCGDRYLLGVGRPQVGSPIHGQKGMRNLHGTTHHVRGDEVAHFFFCNSQSSEQESCENLSLSHTLTHTHKHTLPQPLTPASTHRLAPSEAAHIPR